MTILKNKMNKCIPLAVSYVYVQFKCLACLKLIILPLINVNKHTLNNNLHNTPSHNYAKLNHQVKWRHLLAENENNFVNIDNGCQIFYFD